MNFVQLKENWNRFGAEDPFWAIATEEETKGNRWDLDAFYESGRQTVAQAIGSVLALRPQLGRTRALDFGCGVGRLTRGLEPFFQEVKGVDVAASMIERAKALSPPDTRCTYLLNEKPDLRLFEDGSFDFVLTFIVLQHMRQEYSAKYLAEFMRILRPGGICLFQLPDFLINTAEPTADGAPAMEMYGMSPETVTRILAAAGGLVLQVAENDWAGPQARSFTYTVEKIHSGGPLPLIHEQKGNSEAAKEMAADLRAQLELSRTQERALRAENRRLADESRLLRRFAAFALAEDSARAQIPYRGSEAVPAIIEPGAAFSLEAPEFGEEAVIFRGWAYLPMPDWDCRQAAISLLFREGAETFAAPAAAKARPELADLPAAESGGARELAAAGFECRVALASLPADRKFEIAIRLKSARISHEQPTGRSFLKEGPKPPELPQPPKPLEPPRRTWRDLLKS
jgi:SAM-dependent methyltransferase